MKKQNKKRHLKRTYIVLAALVVLLAVLQLFNEPVASRPVTGHMDEVPKEVINVLERSCYSCHSNEQKLSWFDRIAPVSWFVKKDIDRAREVLNFSESGSLSPAAIQGNMYAILNMVQSGKMPLPEYTVLHPGAKISARDISVIKKYALSLSGNNQGAIPNSHQLKAARPVSGAVPKTFPVSPNGVKYTDEFKNWPVISMSILFDNSIRVIYGNEIAARAVREENFHPWPNGSIVVKAVWKQQELPNGEIRTGAFVNAQFMEKDSQRYRDTEGWGFAKFSGQSLTPTGKTAMFAQESCIACHRKLAEPTGYLFDVPLKVNPKSILSKIH